MTERLLVLDIETVPDLGAARLLFDLPAGATNAEICTRLVEHCRRWDEADDEVFIKPALQKLAALAFVDRGIG